MPLPHAARVWGAGKGCAISPHFPHSDQPRAGAAGQQPAREETPCFGSCALLWHLSQNKIDWHHIPGDSPLSLATPPWEIPGMPELGQLILPDSQIPRWDENRELEQVRKAAASVGTQGWVSSSKPLPVPREVSRCALLHRRSDGRLSLRLRWGVGSLGTLDVHISYGLWGREGAGAAVRRGEVCTHNP